MTQRLAYLNGQWLAAHEAALPLHDAGIVWGATITDLARTFRHQGFRLLDHIRRFRRSCERAEVPLTISDATLREVAEKLIAHNASLVAAEAELALVFVATPGAIGTYVGQPGGPGDAPPTLALHTFPLPMARYRSLFTEGAKLALSPAVMPMELIDPQIKHRSRLHWWIAERRFRTQHPSGTMALYHDAETITETTTANVLFVLDGVVVSPPRERILPGISWSVVQELCHEAAIPYREQTLTLETVDSASEGMLTNTAFCLAGIRQLEAKLYPWPGPVTMRLLTAWSQRVGVDIVGQIQGQA